VINQRPFTNPQLIAERDRLNKDLEQAHSSIKALEGEIDNMAAYHRQGGTVRR
jgi:cell division control protein 12